MKVKRMGITEIMKRIWLFSLNKIKSSESFSKQLIQLIIAAHNCYTSLVQIASVRRSLFNNAERGKFLNQLVAGVREILQNPSGMYPMYTDVSISLPQACFTR